MCVIFVKAHTSGAVQGFIDIDSYLKFLTGETILTADSQRDKVHAGNMHKTKEKSILISSLKTDLPPILGGLAEGKESTTSLTSIRTTEIWNDHYVVRVVYPRAAKYLQNQRLNINAGINRNMGHHMEARLLGSEFLGKCGVSWSQLATEIVAFQLHLVTTTYGEV